MSRRRVESLSCAGSGTTPPMADAWSGLVPHVTIGSMCDASKRMSRSNLASSSLRSVFQRSTACVPHAAARRPRPVMEVIDDLVVRRNQSPARGGFDTHVAHGEAAFHAHRAKRAAGVFDNVTGGAIRTDVADHRHHQVLCGHARAERSVDRDAHRSLQPVLQRLRSEQVLDLRRADAERKCAKPAVGDRVAVARRDDHAGQHEPLLGRDDVLDALPLVEHVEELDAELAAVLAEIAHLLRFGGVGDRERANRGRRIDVVNDRKRVFRPPHAPARLAQRRERLRARVFVEHLAVDVQQQVAAIVDALHGMCVDDFAVQRACLCHGCRITASDAACIDVGSRARPRAARSRRRHRRRGNVPERTSRRRSSRARRPRRLRFSRRASRRCPVPSRRCPSRRSRQRRAPRRRRWRPSSRCRS